jgi:hypothetical protein
LGFIIDSERELFSVSDSKIAKLKQVLEEMIRQPSTSPRKLAALAGKILSVSPAVLPAALYSRTFYAALKEKAWDQVFATPQAVKEAASFWLDHIEQFNGRHWWSRPVEIRASVDASGVGFGGVLQMGTEEPVPFMGIVPVEQTVESSTAREIRGYAVALSVAAQQFPDQLRGTSILLEGDNQGAMSVLNHLRSPNRGINRSLQQVFQLCCEMNFDVLAKWIPRENLTEADELSRRPDPSDWGLAKPELEKVFHHFGLLPSIDMFASDSHHVSDAFVSRFYVPGCLAADALRQDWRKLAGQFGLAWVFPPIRYVSLALSLIRAYRQEALICLPVKSGSNELIQLYGLEAAYVSAPLLIPREQNSCIPSCRVPAASLNPAFMSLGVVHIHW